MKFSIMPFFYLYSLLSGLRQPLLARARRHFLRGHLLRAHSGRDCGFVHVHGGVCVLCLCACALCVLPCADEAWQHRGAHNAGLVLAVHALCHDRIISIARQIFPLFPFFPETPGPFRRSLCATFGVLLWTHSRCSKWTPSTWPTPSSSTTCPSSAVTFLACLSRLEGAWGEGG